MLLFLNVLKTQLTKLIAEMFQPSDNVAMLHATEVEFC
jgi:hypothetical protein